MGFHSELGAPVRANAVAKPQLLKQGGITIVVIYINTQLHRHRQPAKQVLVAGKHTCLQLIAPALLIGYASGIYLQRTVVKKHAAAAVACRAAKRPAPLGLHRICRIPFAFNPRILFYAGGGEYGNRTFFNHCIFLSRGKRLAFAQLITEPNEKGRNVQTQIWQRAAAIGKM